MKTYTLTLLLLGTLILLSGCGTLTGLPGHGGGKRFAVEQELVAAATRGAIKQIDLNTIKGRKVNLFVNAIGDTGTGNLVGGRFSVVSQLRGDYIQSPVTSEKSVYPRYTSTSSNSSTTNTSSDGSSTNNSTSSGENTSTTGTTTTNGNNFTNTTSGGSSNNTSTSTTSGQSTTDTLLPSPESKETKQTGAGGLIQTGVEYKGLGAYTNSTEITSNDLQYLSGLLQTYLYLKGVNVVPPSEAEVDVYITVDVFGTVRTRVDWFLANNEILRAKTSIEVLAIDHLSGQAVMAPQTAGAEAEYNEQFILWAGPITIRKTLKKAEPLLSDFTGLTEQDVKASSTKPDAEQSEPIPYPFRQEVEHWRKKE